MRRVFIVCVLLALNGCAYYNGMYNANRLAGRAEKAEREGRTFDAANFWNQAIVKADSVLRRHPDSKWADDARLIRARALARLDRCEAAIPALVAVQQELAEPELAEAAGLDLGRCQLEQGDLIGAEATLAPLQASADPARRARARVLLGRTRLAARDYADALELLATDVDTMTPGHRMLALAGAGQVAAARALADTLIDAKVAYAPWREFLRELGRSEPAQASAYLDRLAPLAVDPGERARWLADDAARRLADDRGAALERLTAAATIAPGSEAAIEARARGIRLMLASVPDLDSLGRLTEALQPSADDGLGFGAPRDPLLSAAELVQRTADSASTRPPHGDMLMFLAGELARDSLGAPVLAADLMRRVARDWPASPYAPKALLALMLLDRRTADSARAQLETLYGGSPYVAVAQGIPDSSFRTLEDSLGTYAVNWLADAQAGANRAPGRRQPGGRAARPEDELPRARRPNAGGRPGAGALP